MNSGFNVATAQIDDYETPPWLFKALHAEFDFKIDAAASDTNHLCPRYFTIETDGLKQPWSGMTFCNPPYSDIDPWVTKALREGGVLLLPVRPNSDWFHALRAGEQSGIGIVEIRFLRQRVHFLLNGKLPLNPKTGKPSSPRFASMVAIVR